MSILNLIGDVSYTLFFILLLIMAAVVFYDYLKERSRIKEVSEEGISYESSINSSYSMIISDLNIQVCHINEISENISAMKNPNLNFVLEELNAASERILRGVQAVVDLNYPIDELENENETRES